jgi:hypothetical protein
VRESVAALLGAVNCVLFLNFIGFMSKVKQSENIKVLVRTRPMNGRERERGKYSCHLTTVRLQGGCIRR